MNNLTRDLYHTLNSRNEYDISKVSNSYELIQIGKALNFILDELSPSKKMRNKIFILSDNIQNILNIKTYTIEIKTQGSTHQYITTQAPNALAAINNVTEINAQQCYEYIAREVKNETLSMGN